MIHNRTAGIRTRLKSAMKSFRLSKGWSQREMADFLGVTRRNYEAYEQNPKRGVPDEVLAVFCEYTDTDANWILGIAKKARKTG